LKIAYFDCFSGVSGDMTLGALLACGASEEGLRNSLAGLNLTGWELDVRETEQNGIGAVDVTVRVTEEQGHGRHLYHIEEILQKSSLADSVRERALQVFTHLANAEAKIHQTTPDRIHFHEVGAVDAIVDIVGAAVCLELLGVDGVYCSPLPMGRGFVECMHGTIPLPAPATVELTQGIPVYGVDVEGELVTPTGAALVKTLASGYGPMPPLKVSSQGFGAGKKRFSERPNLLRVVIGVSVDSASPGASEVTVLETNLDDYNPQFFAPLSAKLFEAGALDVYLTAVQMKKGRPGTLLTALSSPVDAERIAELIFQETSTLGIRLNQSRRFCLERDWATVSTSYGEVRIKRGRWKGTETTASPEFEDVCRAAEASGVPVKTVYAEALAAYRNSDA
jgi:uncharacterized protein (TIGR00299 family) protein